MDPFSFDLHLDSIGTKCRVYTHSCSLRHRESSQTVAIPRLRYSLLIYTMVGLRCTALDELATSMKINVEPAEAIRDAQSN